MEYEEFVVKVGMKVRELRLKRGVTQEEMDEGPFSVSYRTVQNIETGKFKDIKMASIFKIAKRLEVEPKDLLDVR